MTLRKFAEVAEVSLKNGGNPYRSSRGSCGSKPPKPAEILAEVNCGSNPPNPPARARSPVLARPRTHVAILVPNGASHD